MSFPQIRSFQLAAPEPGEASAPSAWPVGTPYSNKHILKQLIKVALPTYPQVFLGMCSNLWGGILVARTAGGDNTQVAGYGMGVVLTQQSGFSLIWGASCALLTLSSQSFGSGAHREVGILLQRAVLVILVCVALPLGVIFINAHRLLTLAGQLPEVSVIVGDFALIRLPGLLFCTVSQCLYKTLTSIDKAKYVALGDIVGMVTNVTLSLFIIPIMGVTGAAVASVCADGMQALVITIAAVSEKELQRCWPGLSREAWHGWVPFLKLAVPSMFLCGFEVWVWDAQTFIAGYISPLAQATQSIVPQFCCVMYAVGQAMSCANGSLIGNFLGEGNGNVARRTAAIGFALTFVIMSFNLIIFMGLREYIPYIFTSERSLINSIRTLLPFCIMFSFLDSHQASLTGMFIGLGLQHLATPMVFLCYWIIGVPFGVFLAFRGLGVHHHPMHLEGLWTGMLVGVSLHVTMFLTTVLFLDWNKAAERVRAAQERGEGNNPLM